MSLLLGFTLLEILGLITFGLLIGAISPTFGIGGGLVTVPILVLVYGFDGDKATATSLGVIIFTSISGSIAYIREKRIDFAVALRFVIFAVPGTVTGAFLAAFVIKPLQEQNTGVAASIDIIKLLFGITMLFISIYKITMIFLEKRKSLLGIEKEELSYEDDPPELPWYKKWVFNRDFVDKRDVPFKYTVKLFPGVIFAFFGGFFGSLLGLGGGVIYVPILTMVLGIPGAIATATSTFTIMLTTPFGVGLRFASVEWTYVPFLAIGTIIASWTVPRFLHKIKSEWILTGFWILAMTAAIRIIVNIILAYIASK